ncbi:hypothetical protein, partial [Thiolapillus sp.]|uniref:hypothetical protein n=1 Tax=Thiolapillus sp. TaxID=2017437 RepID=UPI0025E455A6
AHRGVETLHRTTASPSLIAYRRCAILPLPEGRGLSRFLVIALASELLDIVRELPEEQLQLYQNSA